MDNSSQNLNKLQLESINTSSDNSNEDDIIILFESKKRLPPVVNNYDADMKLFIKQAHEAYSFHSYKLSNKIEQGHMLSSLNIKNLTGSDASLKDVWTELLKLAESNVTSMLRYVVSIPGWDIPRESPDFKLLINRHFIDFHWVKYILFLFKR